MNSPFALLQERLFLHFGTDQVLIEPIDRPGFSGTPIYRLRHQDQQFAVRAWPLSISSETKIQQWKQVVTHLATSMAHRDLFPCPEVWKGGDDTSLYEPLADWYWTVAPWMDGSPLSLEQVTEEVTLKLVEKLASLHSETNSIQAFSGPSLGIQERLDRLRSIVDTALESAAVDPIRLRCRYTMEQIKRELSNWERFLTFELHRPRTQHWIVRDMWRENLLVDNQAELKSIVDLGASRVEWPVFDFVRLMGSLHASTHGWTMAYDAYQSTHTESQLPELGVCWMLHRISTGISLAYWNRQSLQVPTLSPMRERIQERMAELLDIWDACP